GCCNQTRYEGIEYICRCFIEQYGVVRLQPTTCCKDPTQEKCQAFCYPVQQPAPPPPAGICPIEQTCGTKCCKPGETCLNNKCMKELQPPPMQLLEPPEIEYPTLVAIPYTTYAFPWWYFAIAILALLVLSYLLLRKTMKTKPAETPKQAPSKTPEKPKRKRKRKRK
ncbi:hypothetical protein KY309_03610, partial [Candidatus Woesearchaeota archaeon]|nr:hypothetical protein [Candidatus Woesearchaeota archaeon]